MCVCEYPLNLYFFLQNPSGTIFVSSLKNFPIITHVVLSLISIQNLSGSIYVFSLKNLLIPNPNGIYLKINILNLIQTKCIFFKKMYEIFKLRHL
jgi:hypothetical protein